MMNNQSSRILVVDDVADNLLIMRAILSEEGYRVSTYNNGIDAIASVIASPPDLILLDVMMPDLDGYEITFKIRSLPYLPFIPILLVAADESQDLADGLDLGADDFAYKPLKINELLGRVRNLLRLKHSIDNMQEMSKAQRVRSNRVFYRQPSSSNAANSGRGHRRWYGERFDLKDEITWGEADEIVQTNFTTRRGRCLQLNISAWHQMLMRGTREYPMHKHTFTLLQVRVTDEESQQLWHPMWLIILGQRRDELTIMDCYLSYRQRFDMEHTLRFSKQRLLMNSFQTPDVEHEENWVQLTQLAYIQLWAARNLVSAFPRPWEKSYHKKTHHSITPSLVQRDF